MTFSSRVVSIQPSPTLALNAKAAQLKKQGHDVLNFAVGEPDYGTPDIVTEKAIDSLKKGRTKYTPAGGSLELREAVIHKLKRDNGLIFEPSQIVCGIGAKEILFHIFLSLLNEGDEVLLTAPCWVSYADQIKVSGGVPIIIPVPEGRNFPTSDTLEQYSTPKTKAFVLNSPNNPSGYVLKTSELKSLGDYLSTKNWWIISDEIYEYMCFDGEHQSLLSTAPDLKNRFALVNGLSKAFSMTGWRVGYCAAPPELASLVRSLQSHSSTCIPGFIEDAAIVALNSGKPLMAKEISKLKARRDLALKNLQALGDLKYISPQGAFYIFIDIRKHLAPGESTIDWSEKLLNKYHLALAPGEAFGAPGFLRLSYATSDEIIVEGIRRLYQALSKKE